VQTVKQNGSILFQKKIYDISSTYQKTAQEWLFTMFSWMSKIIQPSLQLIFTQDVTKRLKLL